MAPLKIPTFALVGQPNNGKTTVLATLAEDDSAEISSRPGTTLRCHSYPIVVDGKEVLCFIDTPGFEEAAGAREWMTENARKHANPAAAFIEAHLSAGRFPRECELLRPIAEGAAIIYVVDASIPVRQPLREEIELIRLLHNPRIAVINSKGDHDEMLDQWRKELRQAAMSPRIFNGHRANFSDRIALLQSMKGVIEEWEPMLDHAIAALLVAWRRRIHRSADAIADLLTDCLTVNVRSGVNESEEVKKAASSASDELQKRLAKRETKFRAEIRGIFQHTRTDGDWLLPENSILKDNLFSERVWRFFGLSRTQLTAISSLMGATVGGIVDAHVGMASWGAGAVIGAGAGALMGYLGASQGVKISIPGFQVMGVRLPSFKARVTSDQVEARASTTSNLPWILLDRAFSFFQLASTWAHGRQERFVTVDPNSNTFKEFTTTNWSAKDRAVVTSFLKRVYPPNDSPKQAKADAEMRKLFRSILNRITGVEQEQDASISTPDSTNKHDI